MTLPIETHLLQACVSEPVKPVLDGVVTFGAGHFYISQSDKGEMVMEEQITESRTPEFPIGPGPETQTPEFPIGPMAQSDNPISYDQLRARLPNEITDDIVELMANSAEALEDFAMISSQQDVDLFNQKYSVNLVLPSGA